MEEVSTVVDFSSVLHIVGTLLLTVLLAVAVFGINWIRQKMGLGKLEEDALIRKYLEDAITAAIGYAIAQIPGKITVSGKGVLVAGAATYVLQSVPDALKHFGITEARLKQMIEARVAAYLEPDEPADSVPTGAG